MPAMIGKGFLKRAASMKARSWVLSPISARATTPVEISSASITSSLTGRDDDHTSPRPMRRLCSQRSCQVRNRLHHDRRIKYVDASPFAETKGDYSPMTREL